MQPVIFQIKLKRYGFLQITLLKFYGSAVHCERNSIENYAQSEKRIYRNRMLLEVSVVFYKSICLVGDKMHELVGENLIEKNRDNVICPR